MKRWFECVYPSIKEIQSCKFLSENVKDILVKYIESISWCNVCNWNEEGEKMKLETFEVFKDSDAYYDRKPSAEFKGRLIAQQRIEVRTQYGEPISTIDAEAIKLLFNQGYVVIFRIKRHYSETHKDYLKSIPWLGMPPRHDPEPRNEWFKKFDNVEDAKREFEEFIESETKKYQGE